MFELSPRQQCRAAAVLLAACLSGFAHEGHALDPDRELTQYTVDIWDSEDGLPVNSILSITQTEDGYLWLASQSGLARFNGVSFRVYDAREHPELANVSVVFSDGMGELWIGTEGAGPRRFVNGAFPPAADHETLSQSRVMAFHQGRDGTVWVGTLDSGLFGVRGDVVRQITTADGLGHNDIRDIIQDRTGALWVATDGAGVCRLDDGQVKCFDSGDGLPSDLVLALAETPDATIWVGTYGGGAARIRDGKVTLLDDDQALPHDVVRALTTDSEGSLWFGTYGGLCRYRDDSLSCIDRGAGLSSSFVRSLYLDIEGSLWVGTFGGGLSRLKDGTITTYSTREGLSAESVWSVFQDSRQRLWVGTNGGGLNCLLPEEERRVITTLDGLSHDTVLALSETADGSIWAGTRDGLNRLDDHGIQVFTTEHGLPSNFVRVLFVDRRDRLWVGTAEGLSRLQGQEIQTLGLAEGLPDEEIRCILENSDGEIWVGTSRGGLALVDGETLQVIHIPEDLAGLFVTDVYEDRHGTLWIATDNGLFRRSAEGMFQFQREDGLPDEEIYRILEDDSGNLWLSSSLGVFSLAKKNLAEVASGRVRMLSARVFGKSDGMRAVECNGGVQPSGWKTRDGRLWFPTGDGVVTADPGRLVTNARPPTIVLESVLVNDEPVKFEEGLRLRPGRNRLEVHYAALSLLEPRRVRYRYILEGFDESWSEAGNRNVAYYTNIPPGTYSFRVTGSNNDGVWSPEPATLQVEAEPSFVQTPFFHMLWIAGLAGLTLLAVRLRDRRLRQKEQELLRQVDERTHQLADANRQLERLVHVDGLTEIANRRHFESTLDVEWRRHSRYQSPLAIIMVDLDEFKKFNDTYGHQEGDDCLRRVARALELALRRPADLVARYGGEEFVALLPDTSLAGAADVAERMGTQVANLGIPHASSTVTDHVTVSLGVASASPEAGSSPVEVVQAADTALYAAKAAGRNTIRIADDR